MKVVIAGGGTGGHVFPAIAIARELEKEIAGVNITFVGTARGLEARVVPKAGYDIRFIRSEGLVGKNIFRTVKSLCRIPFSFKDSYEVLKDIEPDMVVGVGGYSSGPLVLCAKMMGVPTLIHEQNTMPGFANKVLGKYVDTVAVTYHESMKFFPVNKTYLTGNPVRGEIVNGSRARGCENFHLDKDRFTIFVFGGSMGAHSINHAVGEALEHLGSVKDRIQFLHQTGEREYDSIKEVYRSKGFSGTVIPFAYEMAEAYAVADLIISRAGATTLAELTACGKASILIPYPYAAGNHQEINARKLWDMGAAQMMLDRDLDGKRLSDLIVQLMEEPDAIAEMERISKSMGSIEAARKIIDLIKGLLKKRIKE
jgi:UDP-N-acetylglucosamine--N-acetylmuramyl-(pentapeptide) pyrophosphoryl-undecaprenol N-acetylglucosamine transferase